MSKANLHLRTQNARVRDCKACGYLLPRSEFFPNHWVKPEGDEFRRCKTCVKAGIFTVTHPNPDYYWVGWPKCPLQVLIERGWSPRIDQPPSEYSTEKIGELILAMPDHRWLLKNFEIAGHYGYGGIDEGLCCMPGCVKDTELNYVSSTCRRARYCSPEHHEMHWGLLTPDANSDGESNLLRIDGDGRLQECHNLKRAQRISHQHTRIQLHFRNIELERQRSESLAHAATCIPAPATRPSTSSGTKSPLPEEVDVPLVLACDQPLATRFSFAVLSEYTKCTFQETDRQGKRRGLKPGFPGIQCRHCRGGSRKGGRFFPSTIKTMADTKKTLISIQNHLLKCDKCPSQIKEGVMALRLCHEVERKKQKYGSQKAFFLNIWNRLHGGTANEIQR